MSNLAAAIGKVKQSKGKQQFAFGFATAKGVDKKPKYALLIGAKGKTSKSDAEKVLPKIEKYIQGACWSSADGATVWFWGEGLSAFHVQQMIRVAKEETNSTHTFKLAKEGEKGPENQEEHVGPLVLSKKNSADLLEEYRIEYEDTVAQRDRLLEKDGAHDAALQELLRQAEEMAKIGNVDKAIQELKSIKEEMAQSLLKKQLAKQIASRPQPSQRPRRPNAANRIKHFVTFKDQSKKTKEAMAELSANASFRPALEKLVERGEALGKKRKHEEAAAQLRLVERLVKISRRRDPANERDAEAISEQYQAILRMANVDDPGAFDPRAESALAALEEMVEPATNVPTKEKWVSAFNDKFKATLHHFLELQKSDPKRAEPLKSRFREAEASAKIGKYEQAIDLLHAVDRQVRQIADEGDYEDWRLQADEAVKKNKLKRSEAPIGKGGMGAVYKLEPTDAAAGEALPSLVAKSGRDVIHEAKMYEAIGPHPNVARCLGYNHDLGLIMESVSGGDMKAGIGSLLEKLEKGEIRQADYWGVMQFTLQRTLEVMDHIASRGIVHSDLKPDNIMFDATTGEVKVVDLGTAEETGNRVKGYTRGLVAPELPAGEEGDLDPAQDMFSLGATAYEAAENKRFAYGAQDPKSNHEYDLAAAYYAQGATPLKEAKIDPVTKAPIKETGAYAPGLKTAYVQFLEWAMNSDPKKRPSAKEALEHPFMKDRIIGDEAARSLIKDINRSAPPQKRTVPADPRLGYVAILRKRFAKLNQECTAAIKQNPKCKDGLMKLAHDFAELMKDDNFDAAKPEKANHALDAFAKAIEDAVSQG